MDKAIENEREFMLMVSAPKNEVWYQLQFSLTVPLDKVDKADIMEMFEAQVENIRTRLLNKQS